MRLRSIVLSWDLLLAVILGLVFLVSLPESVPVTAAKDIYGVSISVLAIVFSVFFAALAIIITASDDDFVRFLEEEGHYSTLIWSFRYSLLLLFIALIWSIMLYARSAISSGTESKWLLVVFSAFALYSLFAAAASSFDAITYADFRRRFLGLRR